jgi:hypothetical protein
MRCERMRATIATSVCIRRQERPLISGKMDNEVFYECRDCEQGRRVKQSGKAEDDDIMELLGSKQTDAAEPQQNLKVCSHCKHAKPLDQFGRKGLHGRQAYCRPCANELVKESNAKRKARNLAKEPTVDGSKTCSSCGKEKLLAEFAIDRAATDGHRHVCKGCDSARSKARRKVETNMLQRAKQIVESTEGQKKVTGQDVTASGPIGGTEASAARLSLTIDFSDYPEVMQAIVEAARDEDRTPEQQVRWWIRLIAERLQIKELAA